MKNLLKIITVLVISISFLLLSACKDKTKSDSNMKSRPTEIIVNENAPDDITDPENTENNNIGSQVTAGNLTVKRGKANGIDVSKWQGKIDWNSVKSDGIDFAIIRIGYRGENGLIYRDANADYNMQQAQKAGVLVGVYFFSTATNVKEATEEATFVINAIKGYKISYPVVYDCEGYTNSTSRMYSLTASERTANAIAFLTKINDSGYEPMFYGAKADLNSKEHWVIEQIENQFKIWIAYYPTSTYPSVETPDYNGKYDMWQYTNRGTVKGIEGNCDMIVSYFTRQEAQPKDSTATLPNATVPKTDEELLYTDVSEQVTAKEEVNLREGPGTKYNIAGKLMRGEFLTRIGVGKNGWSKLLYNGKTVYAITSYLSDKVIEAEKDDIVNGSRFTPANDRVTAKIEVNLRSAPSTNSGIVGKLTSGTFLDRIATGDNGWSRLNFNGKVVYAITSYLTTEVPNTSTETQPETENRNTFTENGMLFTIVSMDVTAKERTNLRDKPTTNSNIVYTLTNGEYVKKIAVSNSGWAKLEYNGQYVYAIDSFLTQ